MSRHARWGTTKEKKIQENDYLFQKIVVLVVPKPSRSEVGPARKHTHGDRSSGWQCVQGTFFAVSAFLCESRRL